MTKVNRRKTAMNDIKRQEVDELPRMGLRERKKLMNQATIEDAALRLFQEHGYEETSIQDIADAVMMSSRTFFRYFASKEDVLFAPTQAIFSAAIVFLHHNKAIRPLKDVLSATFAHMAALYQQQSARFLAIYHVTMATPSLEVNYVHYLATLEPALSEALMQHETSDGMQLSERGMILLVATSMTAFRVALQHWLEDEARDDAVQLTQKYLKLLLDGHLLTDAPLP
jgi:AcrR family transcriptional regulator